jgi:hypothetical protein
MKLPCERSSSKWWGGGVEGGIRIWDGIKGSLLFRMDELVLLLGIGLEMKY